MASTFTRGRHRSIAGKALDRTFEPVGSGPLPAAFVGVGCSDLLALLLQLSGTASKVALGVPLRRRDDENFLGIVRFRIHSRKRKSTYVWTRRAYRARPASFQIRAASI
jgi:hypothetical protein